ncbi:DNA replication and repair protein RadA [Cohaesibacter sp. ES.047]|uniref:DNA repair protein RadA n=1 Tax=Cohaesibacter sp. ES.047 TaxID=1798205 RepID=UPI000BB895DD|nr:DNA repair protein RadA [Cohaesibacter sp. ES.047]SNY93847.1 DNA replication and repair protein RadA [Cohaesibacter sp. ES.047]
MARSKSTFVCQTCGAVTNRWAGRCEACGEWNSIMEEKEGAGIGGSPKTVRGKSGRIVELVSLSGQEQPAPRITTNVAELDRVTGGGFVKGSVLLLGGDPGIGKSTLLIQASAALTKRGHRVVYISGEEAIDQVRLRAARLGLAKETVELAAETSVEDILATLTAGPPPEMVIIDSIQTLWTDSADSAPGTVTQVRASAQAMIRYAKQTGAAVILVGHVTKDGQIAGPRVVEHMVDGVLQFEGDSGHQFRILRAIKNRFGPTDEIGVFEMTGGGLSQVANPSAMFLGERNLSAPGAAVFAGMEGSRPLLVEIQALVAQSPLGTPRRAVVGWDTSRLSMILAVLDAHCGVRLSGHDVYLNVAGGMKISEPAADLAVAAALVSSLAGVALPSEAVYFGEISLSGAIRPVSHAPTRIKESAKLGFSSAVVPEGVLKSVKTPELELSGLEGLTDLVARIAVGSNLNPTDNPED